MPTYAARMGKRPSQAPRLSVVMAGDEMVERKVSVRDFVCSHVKTIATLIMIVATLLCIVLIVMVHKWKFDTERAERIHTCLDVAVIGAGLSGTYTAWRLRDAQQRVAVMETSERVGGRMHTWRPFPEASSPVNAELGALFYLPQQHSTLNHTIHVLKLTPVEFHPPNRDPPILYLRGRSLTLRDLNSKDPLMLGGKNPYHLRRDELGRQPKDLRKFILGKLLANNSNLHTHPLYATDKEGRHLYLQGFWNFLAREASFEAISMLSDTSPWRSMTSNSNAALLAAITLDRNEGQMTLKEGMDAVPKRLAEEFVASDPLRHKIHKNKRLACITKEDGYYDMIFIHTRTKNDVTTDRRASSNICAKKVVMALPPPALARVLWKKFTPGIHEDAEWHQLQQRLTTLEAVPGLVAYFVYSSKWWTEYHEPWMQDVITDLPIKRVRYVGEMHVRPEVAEQGPGYTTDNDPRPKHLFMVANLDGSDYDYFHSLLGTTMYNGFMKMSCDNSSHLVQDVTQTLALIYGVKHVPPPDDVYVVDWTHSPSRGARFFWKTGVWWETLAAELQRPRPAEDVFVVGDAYCPGPCQVWAEGAVDTVERLFQKHQEKFFGHLSR
ncbi:hypothetical protein CAPTEDRAFT_218814 [Capitella teleta]|uniref:Amine oxidase domain-containing protein n=1 Tax=Capitella teleta TaxID=283909 RepID=R7U7R4_CAPTE|nr:hypothetical protein CAPTEDRAFT_218814 [Capitella teleta]|eukprot:ELU02191.1 hypothetical protein CAPTEDRAFT_218814 [Capitella teleta]